MPTHHLSWLCMSFTVSAILCLVASLHDRVTLLAGMYSASHLSHAASCAMHAGCCTGSPSCHASTFALPSPMLRFITIIYSCLTSEHELRLLPLAGEAEKKILHLHAQYKMPGRHHL